MTYQGAPNIWLRPFYGFDPSTDGYIGWTKETERNWFLNNATAGDLFLIYGADTRETLARNRRQLLGILQVDLEAIRDVEKCAIEGRQRKIDSGWKDKWTYALPVRRAWRIERRIAVGHLLPITYNPRTVRFLGREHTKLTPDEVNAVLQLPVTEVAVWGEPSISIPNLSAIRFEKVFYPSPGITPAFGLRGSTYEDGEHWLYLMSYNGNIAAFLGREEYTTVGKMVVKIGYANDVTRRLDEINCGVPPKARHRWGLKLKSCAYPTGVAAKAAEDALKAAFGERFESLGGEFFFGDKVQMESQFASAPNAAQFTIKATKRR